MPQEHISTDVLIVGGGPAGLAAGIAFRQKGIDCLVVDALEPPIEKGCGEGLMPDTLQSLRELGITINEEEGCAFKGISFIDPIYQVDACFPNGTGIGIRRTHLHRRMHQRAQQMGVRFAWGSHARLSVDGKVAIGGADVRFKWLVGADGTASRVRKWAGLDAARQLSQRVGYRRHYRVAPWSAYVEVYWGPTGQVYVTPLAPDQVCLVFLTRDKTVDRQNFLDGFPAVVERLGGGEMVTAQRAALSASRRLKRIANGSIALIGDASGSVDAITGEGLAMTFRQALSLASSLDSGDLNAYGKAHREIGDRPHAMSKLMLLMDRWPLLRKHGIRALASNRTLFEELLSVHVGVESLAEFAFRRGPALGLSLLAGAFEA